MVTRPEPQAETWSVKLATWRPPTPISATYVSYLVYISRCDIRQIVDRHGRRCRNRSHAGTRQGHHSKRSHCDKRSDLHFRSPVWDNDVHLNARALHSV